MKGVDTLFAMNTNLFRVGSGVCVLLALCGWGVALGAPVKTGVQVGAWSAILSAGPLVQLTLVVLVALSVLSWAIIFAKWKQFDKSQVTNSQFLDVFWRAKSLEEVASRLNAYTESPVARVFKAGFNELQRIAESGLGQPKEPKLVGIDNLARALRKAGDIEISLLESRLSVLATTGSTGPFIGLFGTVWGIMTAFQKIGETGAASLAVVAPGISEALIATAIGLVAAIPAVVAYNHFITKTKREELEISNFTSDFLNIAKRNFFKGE